MRMSCASGSSARHSSRPPRIRPSSSLPAETTWPGCTRRCEITPSSGARSVAKPRRSRAFSSWAWAVWRWAWAVSSPAISWSASLAATSCSRLSISPRRALALATARLASAWASAAWAWRSSICSARTSSCSSGCPALTTSPTSTITSATRWPDSSTPSDICSRAAIEPEAVTRRGRSRCTGLATLTVRLGAVTAAVSSAWHAARSSTASAPPASKRRVGRGLGMGWGAGSSMRESYAPVSPARSPPGEPMARYAGGRGPGRAGWTVPCPAGTLETVVTWA